MEVWQCPATVVFKLPGIEEGGQKVYEYAFRRSVPSEGHIGWDRMQKRKVFIWAHFTDFGYFSVWFSNFPLCFLAESMRYKEIKIITSKLHSAAMQEWKILLLYTELQLLSHLALS